MRNENRKMKGMNEEKALSTGSVWVKKKMMGPKGPRATRSMHEGFRKSVFVAWNNKAYGGVDLQGRVE